MLKIFSADQMRAADAGTIALEPITSIALMERASKAFADWVITRYPPETKIGIVCGTGNNGGDGLAVARMLCDANFHVRVWIIRGTMKESPDFLINRRRISDGVSVTEVISTTEKFDPTGCAVVVDAVFGTGISREPDGIYSEVILAMNRAKAIRLAVDVPSGLFTDMPTAGVCVEATHTITFALPKLAFMFPENERRVGAWHCVDIGLSQVVLDGIGTKNYYTTTETIRRKLHVPAKFANKGNNGKALLIAGSYGKMGACVLAARAALRSGVGLLTLHVPETGNPIVQTAVPEAMVDIDLDSNIFTSVVTPENYTVFGIGPGIGQAEKTRQGLIAVMSLGKPMVLDADALNMMGAHREMLKHIPAGSILTPHPKEFERLAGEWGNDFERLEKQRRFSRDNNAVVVLKGAHTSVALPDGNVYFNSTGNPGMAKGGSGDVLTGILTALLAQGYSAGDAAVIGVFLHGEAGDLAAEEKGFNSMIASDLIEFLPNAFKKTGSIAQ